MTEKESVIRFSPKLSKAVAQAINPSSNKPIK